MIIILISYLYDNYNKKKNFKKNNNYLNSIKGLMFTIMIKSDILSKRISYFH